MYNDYYTIAQASMRGGELAPRLHGAVRFTDTKDGVRVDAVISSLPVNKTGFYGFHIHQKGDCSTPDFSSAKGHYNPMGAAHPQHAGDFPMVLATKDGDAYLSFITTRFAVRDVIGLSVIIHEGRDDYTSQPAGDSGPRIACGVIKPI